MPHIFVTVDSANDTHVKDYELSLDFSLGDLKGLIEADTGLQTSKQMLFFNGQPLGNEKQTLESAGIKDQDMLYVNEDNDQRRPVDQSEHLSTADAMQRIEGLRQQLLNRLRTSPQDRAQLAREAPELVNALDDPAMFREAFWTQQGVTRQERQNREDELAALDNDMSEEGQAKIYEAIRQERVAAEAAKAMDEHPELFGRVTMLYINVEVNGNPVKAFVDSGAQATIMSPRCAEKCNVTKSIDTRFAGIARGVGTAKILGRVHSATMTIGEFKDYQLPCAFTVMEGKDVDLLLGLDMLKRYQATIDLHANKLTLGGGSISTPFLDESELPRDFEEKLESEETVPGPGGASIGVESGALKVPQLVSSSKSVTNFGGHGHSLGASSSSSSSLSALSSQKARFPQTPARSQPPRPTAPTPGAAQFPESSIEILTNLGVSREEAIEALRATNGNVEYAAGMLMG